MLLCIYTKINPDTCETIDCSGGYFILIVAISKCRHFLFMILSQNLYKLPFLPCLFFPISSYGVFYTTIEQTPSPSPF